MIEILTDGTTDPDNFDSQKVLIKVGFKPEGDSPFHGGTKIFKLEL